MNRSTVVLMTAGLAVASLCANAQQTPTPNAPAKTVSSASSTSAQGSLPSEATFNEFLKHMFGWNQDLTWKVVDIKPSEAAGLSEATVIFNTPKGQQATRIYVRGNKNPPFTGEPGPFGLDPFAGAGEKLKGVNGPSKG